MNGTPSPTQSIVLITGLAVRAHVGVGATERRAPQTIIIDVALRLADPAIARDHLSAAVNYADIIRLIDAVVAATRALLLETLAERIASRILADARIAEVTLTITKPRKLPNCDAVGIQRNFRREEVRHA